MHQIPARYDSLEVEAATRSFWQARSLPPASGILGPERGPVTRQFAGSLLPGDLDLNGLQRAVTADIEARVLAMRGQRVSASIRLPFPTPSAVGGQFEATLRRLAVWVGGNEGGPIDRATRSDMVHVMLDRLVDAGVVVSRKVPFRTCPRCRAPRSPESIVYQEEEGTVYLLRFVLPESQPRTSILVWIDAAWKLLGTIALLLNPDLPYVVARFRRRGEKEQIITSKSSVDRLRQWLPESEIEILEERFGREWRGVPYRHPLANELPTIRTLAAPAGTIIPSSEVVDTGTGVVALVPAHGGLDSVIAHGLRISGWKVLTDEGSVEAGIAQNYSGLSVEEAEELVLRDLLESGTIFAEPRVRRGVPHCVFCGSALVWQPSRTWCLDPGRFPKAIAELYTQLLPAHPPLRATEEVPWPISEPTATKEETAPVLYECPSCDRLQPASAGRTCVCGEKLALVRRELFPVFGETLASWAQVSPFSPGEEVRLYVPERGRATALIQHLAGMLAVDAHPGKMGLTSIPTIPPVDESSGLLEKGPHDAIRSALVKTDVPIRDAGSLINRRNQETRRLRKFWEVVRLTTKRISDDGYSVDSGSILNYLAELPEEDRAFLSTFERMRIDVLRRFETGSFAAAHAQLARFMEVDLRRGYLNLIRDRLEEVGLPRTKVAAYRVLTNVLPLWAELYAPFAPLTMEAIHRAFRGDNETVTERGFSAIQESILNADLERAYGRWRNLVAGVDHFRRELGVSPKTPLPLLVLSVTDEVIANELRGYAEVVRRLVRADALEIASPSHPWEGKRIEAHPILAEIQRAYPTHASRVARVLQGLPGRRVQESIRSGAVSIALEGLPVSILPSMVEFVESLPEGVVPVPWSSGEVFAQIPAGVEIDPVLRVPALSADGNRVLNALKRRLRRIGPEQKPNGVILGAKGPMREELERYAPALSRYFGGIPLRIVGIEDEVVPAETQYGNTSRGDRWTLRLVGIPTPVSPRKQKRTRSPRSRVPPASVLQQKTEEKTDYLDDRIRQREESIRDLVRQLDGALGFSWLGPSKLAYAWDDGLQTLDAVAHAPFQRLANLPGFGPYVAAEIIRKLGDPSTIPARPDAESVVRRHGLGFTPSNFSHSPSVLQGLDVAEPSDAPDAIPASFFPEGEREPVPPVNPPVLEARTPSIASPIPITLEENGGSIAPSEPRESEGTDPLSVSPPFSLAEDESEFPPKSVPPEPERSVLPVVGRDSFPPSEAEVPINLSSPPVPDSSDFPNDGLADSPPEEGREPAVSFLATEAEPSDHPVAAPTPSLREVEVEPIALPSPLPPPVEAVNDLSDGEGRAIAESESSEDRFPTAGSLAPEREMEPPPTTPVPTSEQPPLLLPELDPPLAEEGTDDPSHLDSLSAFDSTTGPPEPMPESAESEGSTPPETREDSTDTAVSPTDATAADSILVGGELASMPPAHPDPEFLVETHAVEVEGQELLELDSPPMELAEPRPSSVEPPTPPPRPSAGLELWPAPTSDAAWQRFLEATSAGHRGLCISREFPERLRAFLGQRPVEVVWLTNLARGNSLRPNDLPGLAVLLERAFGEQGVTAVYLEGIEYLVRIHSAARVAEVLRALDTAAKTHDARVWVPINPELISSDGLSALTNSFPSSTQG